MAITQVLLNDRNGNPINVPAVSFSIPGYTVSAFVHAIGDRNGNLIDAAPGGVALGVSSEGLKTGYRYAILGFAPVATPTDVLEIKGSATKTVRIRRIKVGGVATAAGNMPVQLIRRSAADTLGGAALTVIAAMLPDTAYAAATAVVSSIGTANPGGLGTQAGGIAGAGRAQLTAVGSGVAAFTLEWTFDRNALVLRGVAQFIYLNMNGAALPAGALFDIEVETEEDAS